MFLVSPRNKTPHQIISLDFNVLDSLNTKLERSVSPFICSPCVRNLVLCVTRVRSCKILCLTRVRLGNIVLTSLCCVWLVRDCVTSLCCVTCVTSLCCVWLVWGCVTSLCCVWLRWVRLVMMWSRFHFNYPLKLPTSASLSSTFRVFWSPRNWGVPPPIWSRWVVLCV